MHPNTQKVTILALLLLALYLLGRKKPREHVTSKLCDQLGGNCVPTSDVARAGMGDGTTTGAGSGTVEFPYVPFPVGKGIYAGWASEGAVPLDPKSITGPVQGGPAGIVALMDPRGYATGKATVGRQPWMPTSGDFGIPVGDAYYQQGF